MMEKPIVCTHQYNDEELGTISYVWHPFWGAKPTKENVSDDTKVVEHKAFTEFISTDKIDV